MVVSMNNANGVNSNNNYNDDEYQEEGLGAYSGLDDKNMQKQSVVG